MFSFRSREITMTLTEVEFYGQWFSTSDVYRALENLEYTDGFMGKRAYIEEPLGKVLEKLGVCMKANQGSYYRQSGYKQFYSDFQNACEHPNSCECDNTHENNDTVCRYCWSKGRRKWNDPEVEE